MKPSLPCRLAALALAALAGCGARREDPEALPPGALRADYEVFAERCSKCHALARATDSGIDDDGYWEAYVARMRLQPGSGISHEDARVILRYLHAYSIEQRQKKSAKAHPEAAPPASAAPPGGGT